MRAWVEIDIDNLKRNIRNIQAHLTEDTRFMGIIKADAYGHGAIQIARALRDEGVSCFGIATADEAIALRQNGFNEDILILGYTAAEDFEKVIDHGITPAIYTLEQARELNRISERKKQKTKVHIKIDTGMSRLGFPCDETTAGNIRKIADLKNLEIEGIFSHLATADCEDNIFVYQQFRLFLQMLVQIEDQGVKIPVKHIANSAATLNYPEMHLDMVRVGIILYGLYPSVRLAEDSLVPLVPVMSIKAKLAQVKWVEKGSYIGYGAGYRVEQRMKIGTVPVGYADGVCRAMSNNGYVFVNGIKCPIVGKICMDQFMIDITAVSEKAEEGDEVLIMGSHGEDNISADDIAAMTSTISYEVVTRIGKRLPRIYISRGHTM